MELTIEQKENIIKSFTDDDINSIRVYTDLITVDTISDMFFAIGYTLSYDEYIANLFQMVTHEYCMGTNQYNDRYELTISDIDKFRLAALYAMIINSDDQPEFITRLKYLFDNKPTKNPIIMFGRAISKRKKRLRKKLFKKYLEQEQSKN